MNFQSKSNFLKEGMFFSFHASENPFYFIFFTNDLLMLISQHYFCLLRFCFKYTGNTILFKKRHALLSLAEYTDNELTIKYSYRTENL